MPAPTASKRSLTNRFTRRPIRTSVAVFMVLGLLLEIGLRVLAPPAVEFAYASRQIYQHHPEWFIDFIPSRETTFRLPLGETVLDFEAAINEFGFRDGSTRRIVPGISKTKESYIHAIGDSFTMGWGVNFSDSYPAQLQELITAQSNALGEDGAQRTVGVLNLGLNGYGAIGATGKSVSLLDEFPPSAAIYLATANDYQDDQRATRFAGYPQFVRTGFNVANWSRHRSYIASTPFALRWWLRQAEGGGHEIPSVDESSTLTRRAPPSIVDVSLEGLSRRTSDPSLGLATKSAILHYAKRMDELEVPFIVIVHGDDEVVRDLEAFCREQRIATRRILVPGELVIPGDGHYTRQGNRAVADYVLTWLETETQLW